MSMTFYSFEDTIMYPRKMNFSNDGNLGIGTTMPNMSIIQYNEWQDILKTAETNQAVKRALEQLKTTYFLSKEDHGRKT